MIKLLPLRVPNSWTFVYNSFYDEEMIIKNEEIENFNSFKEDVLNIRECGILNSKYQILNDGYEVHLGWYPDSDPNGEYKIELSKDALETIVLEHRTKDRSEAIKVIEACLEYATLIGFDGEKILAKAFEEEL